MPCCTTWLMVLWSNWLSPVLPRLRLMMSAPWLTAWTMRWRRSEGGGGFAAAIDIDGKDFDGGVAAGLGLSAPMMFQPWRCRGYRGGRDLGVTGDVMAGWRNWLRFGLSGWTEVSMRPTTTGICRVGNGIQLEVGVGALATRRARRRTTSLRRCWRHRGCWRAGRGRTWWRRGRQTGGGSVRASMRPMTLRERRGRGRRCFGFGVGLGADDKLVGDGLGRFFGRSNDEPGCLCRGGEKM